MPKLRTADLKRLLACLDCPFVILDKSEKLLLATGLSRNMVALLVQLFLTISIWESLRKKPKGRNNSKNNF